MKTILFPLCILLLLPIGCANSPQATNKKESITTITIDWDNVQDTYDYSALMEDSLLVVPLEFRDDCIIGEITYMAYDDSLIYIADRKSQAVCIFGLDGKLRTNLHAYGEGPEEYRHLTAFTLYHGEMIIFDLLGRKLLAYDQQGHFLRSIDASQLWANELFTLGNDLYLANEGAFHYQDQDYHLFAIDVEQMEEEPEPLLPGTGYQGGWGTGHPYCTLGDEALFTPFPYETLYLVKDREVQPVYRVDFGKRRLPKKYIYNPEYLEALHIAIKENYVIGLARIAQSSRFLFLNFGDANSSYTCIYDKKTGQQVVAKQLVSAKKGPIRWASGVISNGFLLQALTAEYWEVARRVGQSSDFQNIGYNNLRQAFTEYLKKGTDEVNPVILIQKLKE